MKFYKYQSLSEEKHFKFLQNYLAQKIWLTPLKNFNDPFEGRFAFTAVSPEYILNNPKFFTELLHQHHLYGESDLTENELKKRLTSVKFLQELNSSSTRIVKEKFSEHGALCLSTENDNIPMWAYYADNHKGYCVEFELDFSKLQEFSGISANDITGFMDGMRDGKDILTFKLDAEPHMFVFVKISYSDALPVFDYEKYIKINAKDMYSQIEFIVRNSVGVKFNMWEHENEFRLIANSNSENCGLLNLKGYAPFLKVTGIIIGSRMESHKMEIVKVLCKQQGIKLYKAVCSESSYKIVISDFIDNEIAGIKTESHAI